ncbi:uroporphyrin-III C-methyltransferase [Abortiporus biennis]|nr:uroporphyrin-III C-methyltransferase [Abortiporus biennis]
MTAFPSPSGGASLVLAFRFHSQKIVIIGSNSLAASRAFSALEADSEVIVISKGGLDTACEELRWRAQQQQLTVLDLNSLPGPSTNNIISEAEAIDSYLSTLREIRLVCITDTLLGSDTTIIRAREAAVRLVDICRARNIPVNVTDHPDLCDFSFTSTHRFIDPETGHPSALQIGITTNGQGCRLASRLRREVISRLPKDVGGAATKIGRLRHLAKTSAEKAGVMTSLNEDGIESTPNNPVAQRTLEETDAESARRRMRWVAQVSEYWPIPRLATMSEKEMSDILEGGDDLTHTGTQSNTTPPKLLHAGDSEVQSLHSLNLTPSVPRGRIFLVGSGPGHPSLLTIATHAALTRHADLVLSDKLVPAAVLALIPSHVEVRIARKFPGNADGAQNELMELAIEAANRGLTVVRLKQGDPTVYGRAGEEVLYFRERGYEAVVIPGVSSVLAGPTFAGIPVTQRGAAESFVVCTGVGRQGKEVKLPGYERSRTLVLLMGVARLPQILETLQFESTPGEDVKDSPASRRNGPAYPSNTPIALIERASMHDQRVICSTLKDIAAALESVGEQRPPGMLVIGWSVLSLWGKGDVSVLDTEADVHDNDRIIRWLDGSPRRITEGLELGWEGL